jgi:hypothetical protein
MIRDVGPTLTGQAVRARGTVVPQFLARHALSGPDAMAFTPATPGERMAFEALVRSGAVRLAGAGRFYLDLPRYRLVEEARGRRLALITFGAALFGATLAMLFY